MFDAATIREEIAAIERALKDKPSNAELLNRYVLYSRKLRKMEYDENGFVTARNGVTGY